MAKCTTTTCSIDGHVNPISPSGSVQTPGDSGDTCGTCARRHSLCKCRRRVDRTGRGIRVPSPSMSTARPAPNADEGKRPDAAPVPTTSTVVPSQPTQPTTSTVVPSQPTQPTTSTKLPARVPPPMPRTPGLPTSTITGVSRPADVLRPSTAMPNRPPVQGYAPPPPPMKPATPPPPFLNLPAPAPTPSPKSTVVTPQGGPLTIMAVPFVPPTPPPAPSRPPYCGDPRFADTELCNARPDGSMPPPLSDYCQRRLLELGSVSMLRLDELCSGSLPPARGAPSATTAKASAVAPGGAPIGDLVNCATAFLSLPTDMQARVIEDGRLGAYQLSQAAARDLQTGAASAARVWVDWLGRNFPSTSPEVMEFCESVRGAASSYAAAGAVSAVVMGAAPYSMQFASGGGSTLRSVPGSVSSLSPSDLFAYRTQWDRASVERCVAALRAVDPAALGGAISGVTSLRSNDWLIRLGDALRRGDQIDPTTGSVSTAEAMRESVVSNLANWHARGGEGVAEAIRDLCAAAYRISGRGGYAAAGEPDAAVVIDDGTARDLFVKLPPSSQREVLRGLAFKGQPYAASLAAALDGGLYTVDGYPVPWLLFAWMDNTFGPGSAQRVLFNYDTSLAARANGLLPAAAGDPPTTPAAPAQQGQPAQAAAGSAPPGFTPAQWQQLVATSPEVAARLLTEFQQRPSTFAQVSQTIMQAADRVLQGIHQGAVDDLAAQRAQAEHRQAMAQIELQRQQALAQRAQATMGVDTGLSVTTPTPAPVQYVQPPPPATTPTTTQTDGGTSTGTYVAVGGLALAALGGAYILSGASKHKHNGWRRTYQRAA